MRGVKPWKSHRLYKSGKLAEGAKVLQTGRVGSGGQALTLVHEFRGGRMFYTSLGVRADFGEEDFIRMLDQALFWIACRKLPGTE